MKPGELKKINREFDRSESPVSIGPQLPTKDEKFKSSSSLEEQENPEWDSVPKWKNLVECSYENKKNASSDPKEVKNEKIPEKDTKKEKSKKEEEEPNPETANCNFFNSEYSHDSFENIDSNENYDKCIKSHGYMESIWRYNNNCRKIVNSNTGWRTSYFSNKNWSATRNIHQNPANPNLKAGQVPDKKSSDWVSFGPGASTEIVAVTPGDKTDKNSEFVILDDKK